LRRGEVDVIIDHLPQIPKDIEVLEITQMHTFAVIPAHFKSARQTRLALTELSGETFIAYPKNDAGRALQMKALEICGVKHGAIFQADSAESILGFVSAGIGFSLIPWVSPEGPKMTHVVAKKLTFPGAMLPVYAAWKSARHSNYLRQLALGEFNLRIAK
jgi:DNA-binding transcriptional LysR family regulator